jgi:hypothetical protein
MFMMICRIDSPPIVRFMVQDRAELCLEKHAP